LFGIIINHTINHLCFVSVRHVELKDVIGDVVRPICQNGFVAYQKSLIGNDARSDGQILTAA
jgi:hypothetical protein